MTHDGIFGMSAKWSDARTDHHSILLLGYTSAMLGALSKLMAQVRKDALIVSQNPDFAPGELNVGNCTEGILYVCCSNAMKAGDLNTASLYSHAIMQHHGVKYGVLTYEEEGGYEFESIATHDHDRALAEIKRRLPYAR